MAKPKLYGLKFACRALAGFALASPLSGCLVVGGFRRGGGFFLWPGSIGLLVVLLVAFLLLRRL